MKALAIDETDVEAHVVLAIVNQWYDWNGTEAERQFKRAIELDPTSLDALLPGVRRRCHRTRCSTGYLRVLIGLLANVACRFVENDILRHADRRSL